MIAFKVQEVLSTAIKNLKIIEIKIPQNTSNHLKTHKSQKKTLVKLKVYNEFAKFYIPSKLKAQGKLWKVIFNSFRASLKIKAPNYDDVIIKPSLSLLR